MRKIGIVEIRCSNHEVADLCRIANPDINQITIFTNKRILNDLQDRLKDDINKIEICLQKDKESLVSYMKRISKICVDSYDLVIINTVRNPQLLFFNPGCNVLGFFYSLSWWFKDTVSVGICLKKLFSWQNLTNPFLLANAITGPFIRKALLSKIDGILVEYPAFVKLLKEEYGISKPVYFLPNRFFENDGDLPQNEKLTFVIPGSINEKRKNYDIVLDAFNDLSPEIKNKVKLVLLGRPSGSFGEKVIYSCKELNSEGLTVEYFTAYVPPETMNRQLQKADVIIAPLKFDYRSATVTERYTYTKGTGSFSDSLRFGKPTLVPAEYNIAPEFKDCFVKYKDAEDLARMIRDLSTDNDRLRKLTSKTIETMRKYSLSNLRERFEKIICDV